MIPTKDKGFHSHILSHQDQCRSISKQSLLATGLVRRLTRLSTWALKLTSASLRRRSDSTRSLVRTSTCLNRMSNPFVKSYRNPSSAVQTKVTGVPMWGFVGSCTVNSSALKQCYLVGAAAPIPEGSLADNHGGFQAQPASPEAPGQFWSPQLTLRQASHILVSRSRGHLEDWKFSNDHLRLVCSAEAGKYR